MPPRVFRELDDFEWEPRRRGKRIGDDVYLAANGRLDHGGLERRDARFVADERGADLYAGFALGSDSMEGRRIGAASGNVERQAQFAEGPAVRLILFAPDGLAAVISLLPGLRGGALWPPAL